MADHRVFELRTYYATPGNLDRLQQRFRDHTVALFARHGMELVAFFTPADGDAEVLTYLMAYPDRVTADAAWDAFRADPDWVAAKSASEVDGSLVDHLDSTFLQPTDLSPLR